MIGGPLDGAELVRSWTVGVYQEGGSLECSDEALAQNQPVMVSAFLKDATHAMCELLAAYGLTNDAKALVAWHNSIGKHA